MALSYGSKPTTWTSTLTGLALEIYNNKLSEGIFLPEALYSITVGSTTFTEPEENRNQRVLYAKLTSYIEAKSIIDRFIADSTIELNNPDESLTALNGTIAGGYPFDSPTTIPEYRSNLTYLKSTISLDDYKFATLS